jgi:cell division topological specificity factor
MAMFENVGSFFKKFMKNEPKELLAETTTSSKDAAKERLHVVLMQDRANVSADFLELMKEEIIEVIKKYIVVDEEQIDVRLTNQENEDGSIGAPLLHANIPILNIRNDIKGEYLKEGVAATETISKAPENVLPDPEGESDRTQIIRAIKEEEIVNINKENESEEAEVTTLVVENEVKKENDEDAVNLEVEEKNNTESVFENESKEETDSETKNNVENESELENNKEVESEIKITIETPQEQNNEQLENLSEDKLENETTSKIVDEDSDISFDDDDDDDVTFDDLLKAAEEEERLQKEENNDDKKIEKEDNKEVKQKSKRTTAKKKTPKSKKTKKK